MSDILITVAVILVVVVLTVIGMAMRESLDAVRSPYPLRTSSQQQW